MSTRESLLSDAKAVLAHRFSNIACFREIIGTGVLAWLCLGTTMLTRCYGADVLTVTVFLAVSLLSTAYLSFFLGMLRSSSFFLHVDSRKMDCLNDSDNLDALNTDDENAPTDPSTSSLEDIYQRRGMVLKEHYGFSRRETEVLLMLVRGRDAGHVSETLCISRHTAKCHIYHIYQKTDVHSRQELIDLFEEDLSAK